MAAPTKARTSIWSSQTLTASSADTVSSWVQVDTSFPPTLGLKLTNGATGPTVAAQIQIEVANDYNAGSPTLPVEYGGPLVGKTDNSGVASWPIELPLGTAAVRLTGGSNTGQNVTVDADISKVTGIA